MDKKFKGILEDMQVLFKQLIDAGVDVSTLNILVGSFGASATIVTNDDSRTEYALYNSCGRFTKTIDLKDV